jgi:hypothetical protein
LWDFMQSSAVCQYYKQGILHPSLVCIIAFLDSIFHLSNEDIQASQQVVSTGRKCWFFIDFVSIIIRILTIHANRRLLYSRTAIQFHAIEHISYFILDYSVSRLIRRLIKSWCLLTECTWYHSLFMLSHQLLLAELFRFIHSFCQLSPWQNILNHLFEILNQKISCQPIRRVLSACYLLRSVFYILIAWLWPPLKLTVHLWLILTSSPFRHNIILSDGFSSNDWS